MFHSNHRFYGDLFIDCEREQQSMNKLNLIAVLIKFNPTKYDRVLKILHFFDNYFLTFLGGLS